MRYAMLALLMLTLPAFADEVPVPTEGDGPVEAAPAPDPAPAPCHRCVPGEHDDGFSDSNYSNPEGTFQTEAGDIACCAPGMSQDWAELTGPYFDPNNVPPAPPTAAKLASAASGGHGQDQQGGGSKSGSRH